MTQPHTQSDLIHRTIVYGLAKRRFGIAFVLLAGVEISCGGRSEIGAKEVIQAVTVSGGESFEYDNLHRITKMLNANGKSVEMVYDGMGNLSKLVGTGEDTVLFHYDAVGNRTGMTDPTGQTVYEYDDLDRLTFIDYEGKKIRYGYDDDDRLTKLEYPDGSFVEYKYNETGRLYEVNHPSRGLNTAILYHPDTGLVSDVVTPSSRTRYEYDVRGRNTHIRHENKNGGLLSQYVYGINALGQTTKLTITLAGNTVRVEDYEYDGAGNLTAILTDGKETTKYTYDAAGNRKTRVRIDGIQPELTEIYAYSGNRLQHLSRSDGGSMTRFEYDSAGNLTKRTDPDGLGTHFAYDYRNLLTKVSNDTGKVVEYGYNGDGHRVTKSVDGVLTRYVVDPNRRFHAVLEEQTLTDTKTYTYIGDALFAAHHSGQNEIALADRLGNIKHWLGATSLSSEELRYRPFGGLRDPKHRTQPYGFAGQRMDEETGLLYMRARYMDPSTGRFISEDPAGYSGRNSYVYAGNSPIDFADPLGLYTVPVKSFELGDWFKITAKVGTSMVPVAAGVVTVGGVPVVVKGGVDVNFETGAARSKIDALALDGVGIQVLTEVGGTQSVSDTTVRLIASVPGGSPMTSASILQDLGHYGTSGDGLGGPLTLRADWKGSRYELAVEAGPAWQEVMQGVGAMTMDTFVAVPPYTSEYQFAPVIETYAPKTLNVPQSTYDFIFGPGGEPNFTNASISVEHANSVVFDPAAANFFANSPQATQSITQIDLDQAYGGGAHGTGQIFIDNGTGALTGGVIVNKTAQLLENGELGSVFGGTFDPVAGEVILMGSQATDSLEGIDPEYFYTALQSVYGSAVPPLVSLDNPVRKNLLDNNQLGFRTLLYDGTYDVENKALSAPLGQLKQFSASQQLGLVVLEYNPIWLGEDNTLTLHIGMSLDQDESSSFTFEQDLVREKVFADGPKARCNVETRLGDWDLTFHPILEENATHCRSGSLVAKNRVNGSTLNISPGSGLINLNGLMFRRVPDPSPEDPQNPSDVYLINGEVAMDPLNWRIGERRHVLPKDTDAAVITRDAINTYSVPGIRDRIFVFLENQHFRNDYRITSVQVGSDRQHRRFGGRVENTRLGWVMYEADRLMKCLSVGRCRDAGDPNRNDSVYEGETGSNTVKVPGFKNLVQMRKENFDGADFSDAANNLRLWFAIQEMTLRSFEDADGRNTVLWDASRVELLAESRIFPDKNEPAAEALLFASHFTENYDRFAEQMFIVSDPGVRFEGLDCETTAPGTCKVKIFEELRQVMQSVALARFFRDNNIPLDMWWLNGWLPEFVPSPLSIPTAMNIYESVEGNLLKRIVVSGGAHFCPETVELQEHIEAQQLAQATTNARKSNPTEDTWTVEGNTYAIAVPTEKPKQDGNRRLAFVDLRFPSTGPDLSFSRTYNSGHLRNDHRLGEGWRYGDLLLEFSHPSIFDRLDLTKDEEGMSVWRDENSDTHLHAGTIRLVRLLGGPTLEFDSSFYLAEDQKNVCQPLTAMGLNEEGTADYLGRSGAEGFLLKQLPHGEGFELSTPSNESVRFDSRGRLTEVNDLFGNQHLYTYANNKLIEIADASGQTITLTYEDERLSAVEGPGPLGATDNQRVLYGYNALGLLATVTHELSSLTTEYKYSDEGRLTQVITAKGSQVIDDDAECIDNEGRTCGFEMNNIRWDMDYTVDANTGMRTTSVTAQPGQLAALFWQRRFNKHGQLVGFTDANASEHTFRYGSTSDIQPSIYESPVPGTSAVEVIRTPEGMVEEIINPNNVATDKATNFTFKWYKNDDPETFIGRPYETIDQKSRRTVYDYDPTTKELTKITKFLNGRPVVTTFVREPIDGGGNRVTVTPPASNPATIEWDSQGRLTKFTNSAGLAREYKYNALSQLESVKRPELGGPVTFKHEKFGRVQTVTFPDESTVSYGFDPETHELTSSTDQINRISTYAYDNFGRVTDIRLVGASPLGKDLSYKRHYNAYGGVRCVDFPGGSSMGYETDDLGRVQRVRRNCRTVYEDAEDGAIGGWRIYDDKTGKALISNVMDAERQSRVIELLQGNKGSTIDGFVLETDSGEFWANENQFVAEWSMKLSSSAFRVYFNVETTAGPRYIYYSELEPQPHASVAYVHVGLGSLEVNKWHTIARDLQADLLTDPQNAGERIIRVNRMLVRGSGRWDDVQLLSQLPYEPLIPDEIVYEDGEDGTTTGWRIYDDKTGGGDFANVLDSDTNSRVIELKQGQEGTLKDGFVLETSTGALWENDSHFFAQWSMKLKAPEFRVYIDVQTTKGQRYIEYLGLDDSVQDNRIGYIKVGIESSPVGTWKTFTRDLQVDLESDPQNAGEKIVAVNRLLVRADAQLDDIKLLLRNP